MVTVCSLSKNFVAHGNVRCHVTKKFVFVRPMISNLPRGLSKRVVEAVTNRLLRAMSGADSVASAPAVPETVAVPEEAGAPEAPVVPAAVGENPAGAAMEAGGAGVPRQGRSRSPRISEEGRGRLKAELKDEMVREFLQRLPAVSPDEEITTARVLQSNLSLGVANVQLVARVETCSSKLQEVADGLREVALGISDGHKQLARSLTSVAASVESLGAGVNYHTSQLGGLKGEMKQVREQVK